MTVSMMVLPMQTRRTLLVGVFLGVFLGTACAAIASRALGADLTALPFVTNIYNGYKGNDSPGHALDTEGAIRRYFEPSLAALMVKDRKLAAKRGEVGLLDFDPFVDAQEWDIADFDIAVAETAPGKASATVKFANLGKETTAVLDLVKIKNDWRVSDITWLRDGKPETLRGIYVH
jgi:Protein of unknown function (DUF3828)